MTEGTKKVTQEQDVKRDRLSAYVEPETTELIAEIQRAEKTRTGYRITIGQAVDYLAEQYRRNTEKN